MGLSFSGREVRLSGEDIKASQEAVKQFLGNEGYWPGVPRAAK